MSDVYQVTGHVTAPDGTCYRPEFYGSQQQAVSVANAILIGAQERHEEARVTLYRPDGRVHQTRHVRQVRQVREELIA